MQPVRSALIRSISTNASSNNITADVVKISTQCYDDFPQPDPSFKMCLTCPCKRNLTNTSISAIFPTQYQNMSRGRPDEGIYIPMQTSLETLSVSVLENCLKNVKCTLLYDLLSNFFVTLLMLLAQLTQSLSLNIPIWPKVFI